MKYILLIVLLFPAGSISAQTEYWKIAFRIDYKSKELKELRAFTGIADEPSDIVMEIYLDPQRYSIGTSMGAGMYSRDIVDSVAQRRLNLSSFGDLKEYTLKDFQGNELDETGGIVVAADGEQEDDALADHVRKGAIALTGKTRQAMGLTLHEVRFVPNEKTDVQASGWVVFGKRLSGIMPCKLTDGRVAALVEITVDMKEGGMEFQLLEYREVASEPGRFSVIPPEGYERQLSFAELYGDYGSDSDWEVEYYFDPETYGPHLVPAASYPDVQADYWKFSGIDARGKITSVSEVYMVPGKYRCDYSGDEKTIIVDSTIYWKNEIVHSEEIYSVSRLESYYDSPANTEGEVKPEGFYSNRNPTDVLREGIDFQLLPETRDAGGVTLYHVQLAQMANGSVRGDGWLILQRLLAWDESSEEFLLHDGRKGRLVEYDYTYDKEVFFYGGDRYRMKMTHEPAKTVSAKLFSLAPPKGFEDYKATHRVWKAPSQEDISDEAYEEFLRILGEDTDEEEPDQPSFSRADYAPYLVPAASGGKVKAEHWLIRDTETYGKQEYESYSIPGKYCSTYTSYSESAHTTLVVDSTVYWENFIDHLEGLYSFDRLESFYDSPANTEKVKRSDYDRFPDEELSFLAEGEDFEVLPDTRDLDGITLLHVKVYPTYSPYAGDGWLILQYLPVFRHDEGLQLADGRVGYLLEYSFLEAEPEEGEKPQWRKRQLITHETGKVVDASLFSLAPPKGYTDANE